MPRIRSAMEWEPPGRSGPRHVHGRRFHAPLSGCRSILGDANRGCRFARPPANFCDPYRGRRIVSATSSADDIAATPDLRVRRIRPLGPHPPQTVPGQRTHRPSEIALEGLEKLAGGRAKRTPPVIRPQPTAAPREGCQNAGFIESMGADEHPSPLGFWPAIGRF
jgi:hypothetical protein